MTHIRRWLAGLACAACHALGWAAAPGAGEISLVRGDENYPPFEMVVGGKLKGVHVEMVEAVAQRLGLRVKWQSLPWKRALRMVELGQADGVTYIGRTPEREAWAIFDDDNVLSSTEIRLVVLQARAQDISYDGNLATFLDKRSPIVVRGFEFGLADIDQRKKFAADNMADLVRQLQAHVSDVAVVNWSDFTGAFAGKPEFKQVAPLTPAIKTNYNYIAFAKAGNRAAVAQRFAQALVAYKKSAAYSALLKRYRVER